VSARSFVLVATAAFALACWLAATFDVPTANAVTMPSAEMLTTLESCTVQMMAASGTTEPESSRTSACKGSWALSVIVELAGLTTIAPTFGVTSGAVLPHEELDSATTTMVASVRTLLDIFPLLPSSTPHLSRQDVRRGHAASMADAPHTECRQPSPRSHRGGPSPRTQVQRRPWRQYTSIVTDPLTPPVWAVIVATPIRLPVTRPLPNTVAMLMLEVDQRKF